MYKSDIRFTLFVFGLSIGWVVAALIFFNPSDKVIEQYQLCLESGASVEYCENI